MGMFKNMGRSIQLAALKMAVKAANAAAGTSALPIILDKNANFKDWDSKEAITSGYKSSVYVYKSVNKRAEAAASVPWKVYKLVNNTWELQEGHPLEALIEQPNPFMDRAVFIERMVTALDLAGNSINHKTRGLGNAVVELWPLMPHEITPITSASEFLGGYEYKKGNLKTIFEPADILHAMYVDPANFYWGMAPLKAAAKIVDTDNDAVTWNKIAMQNRGVTDGALIAQQPLNRAQWEEARAQLREQKQGPQNARDMWLLSGGLKYEQFSLSPAEMDFINSRKMTREDIAMTYGVPLPLLGLNDVTYANYEQARKAFWEDTVIQLLNRLRAIFNQGLTPEFAAAGEVLYLDYDTSKVPALQQNEKEIVEVVNKYWAMGVPFNQLNKKYDLGFEDIEGGDTGYIGSGLVPANLDYNALALGTNAQPGDNGGDNSNAGKNKGAAAALEKKTAGQPAWIKGINLETDEQKALYWKAKERGRLAWYAAMTKASASMFAEEGKAVAAAFEKNGNKKAALRVITARENQKAWGAMYLKHYKGIVKQFGEETFSNLKSYGPGERKDGEQPPEELNPMAFNPYDEEIQKYLIENAALKVTGVLDFTKQTIGAIITDMMDSGSNVDDIARAIRKRYDDFSINRAFRIARTEVSAASNYGLFSAGKQAERIIGKEYKKIWVNSADDRVRDSHDFREAVGMEEKFNNGLLYPGDMANGSAKEVIHCRCTLAYKVN